VVESDPERLQQAIERGLRVRIAPVGITGTAYLEIDLVEGAPPPLPIDWTPHNLYIPSAPSTYNQIVRGAQNFLVKLDGLDIETVITDAHKLLVTANTKLEQTPMDKLAGSADATLRDGRRPCSEQGAASPEIRQGRRTRRRAARARDLASRSRQAARGRAAAAARACAGFESPQVKVAANADRILGD
jgi:hypothetical protein